MKLVCNGSELAQAVSRVIKALPTRSINPALEGVLLKAENGTLILTATDVELSIEDMIRAEVSADGQTVVPGKLFNDFVKKFGDIRVELYSVGSTLKVRYEGTEATFNCTDSSLFPVVTRPVNSREFSIRKEDFKDLINKVAFSVCSDESRPVLKGVKMVITEKDITAVALDGYRLAMCKKPLVRATGAYDMVVPARALMEIARQCDNEGDLSIVSQSNYLMSVIDHLTIVTRLIDGAFVQYEHIIPQSYEARLSVPKKMFEEALEKAVLLASSDRNNLVVFDVKDDSLTVTSRGNNGDFNAELPAKLSGMEMRISFNARYFTELLRFVTSDTLVINMISPSSPCVVTPADENDECMYLILPVRER